MEHPAAVHMNILIHRTHLLSETYNTIEFYRENQMVNTVKTSYLQNGEGIWFYEQQR